MAISIAPAGDSSRSPIYMVGNLQTIIVRKKKFGVLLPLADLVQLMGLKDIVSWRFHEITLHGRGLPFGMSFDEFEAATRATINGVAVSDQEFRAFLKSDFQVIDGVIEACSGEDPTTNTVRIDCEDATQWEVTTDLHEIIGLPHDSWAREMESILSREENVTCPLSPRSPSALPRQCPRKSRPQGVERTRRSSSERRWS